MGAEACLFLSPRPDTLVSLPLNLCYKSCWRQFQMII